MTATAHEVLSVAAVVYDQKEHNDREMAFLNAIFDADKEWFEALGAARNNFGAGTETFHIVKRLATATRNAAYQRALAAFEADEEAEIMGTLEAAE